MSHREPTLARRFAGFSLLELMVVLTIMGLLYAFAMPQYRQYVLRTNRTEAQALLVDTAARQARYYAQNQLYVTTVASLRELQLPHTDGDVVLSAKGLYRLIVEPGDGGYLLRAEPTGAQQADSACASLLLNGAGVTGSTGNATPQECWK